MCDRNAYRSDEGVHYGIQQGLKLSHCNVLYFKHNDMKDLERVLQVHCRLHTVLPLAELC